MYYTGISIMIILI